MRISIWIFAAVGVPGLNSNKTLALERGVISEFKTRQSWEINSNPISLHTGTKFNVELTSNFMPPPP